MDPKAPSKLSEQIYEEACAWFVECRAGDLDAAGRRELDRWLRKSPEHLSAYIEVAAIWNEGPTLDPQGKWDVEKLVSEAVQDRDNVVPLTRPALVQPPGTADRAMSGARKRPLRLAAAIAAVAVLVGMLAWWQLPGGDSYATTLGEQRSIALEDGSTVELNSRSRIRVRYTADERSVELIEGQALFRVAKDTARAFVVSSEGTRVRAVGTQFDVYRKAQGTIVTVVEGRVSVTQPGGADADASGSGEVVSGHPPSDASASSALLLAAGEQATVTPNAVRRTEHPNIASATAWTQRQIVFERATLAEVAEEFNRYNERQLVIENAGTYGFHISGVFSSTDPASLVRFLRARPGVQVTESASEIRVQKIRSER